MYTKIITYQDKIEIAKKEAQSLIVEARIWSVDSELDVFKQAHHGMISKVFTLSIPSDWSIDNKTEEELLQYARDNIPDNLTF